MTDKDKILVLLDIIDYNVDPGKEWETEDECTSVGAVCDSIRKEVYGK